MNISSFLQPKMNVSYLSEEDSALTGLRKMRKSGFTAIPVLSGKCEYVGTISEGDFLWAMYGLAEKEEFEDAECGDFPSREGMIDSLREKKISDIHRRKKYPPVRITASMDSLIGAITRQNFVPVVDDRDVFIGIVTRRDVIRYLAQKEETLMQEQVRKIV